MTYFSKHHIRQTDYRKKRELENEAPSFESMETHIETISLPIEVKLLLKERLVQENAQFLATLLPARVCTSVDPLYFEAILKELGLA